MYSLTDKILMSALTTLSEAKKVFDTGRLLGSREQFLSQELAIYKNKFLERLECHGKTELGEPLILTPWVREYAGCVGDLRIFSVATTGNAQCGKTLINTLFLIDFALFSNLDAVWFYPSKTQLDTLVPTMFKRIVEEYLKTFPDIVLNGRYKSNTNYQLRDNTIYFRYTSTSAQDHTNLGKGLTVVGSPAASISVSLVCLEERSQMQPEAVATTYRRLDAARLPGGLIREIGTPGAGLGIESQIELADRHFYPHIICQSCLKEIELNPKGCLLKEVVKDKHLSVTGRPEKWFYSNANDKIKSAYFACPNCKHPISDTERQQAFFKCIKTGETYTKFTERLPNKTENIIENRYKVIVHLSPLLRQTTYNLAAHIIETGISTSSPRDFQQQVLGFASESDEIEITIKHIKSALAKYPPDTTPTVTVAGIDQGRQQDWLVIYKVWVEGFTRRSNKYWQYKKTPNTSPISRLEKAQREVVFMGDMPRHKIPELLKKYSVDVGFIDNEPDISDAYQLSKQTCLEIADQKNAYKKILAPYTILTGALEIAGYGFDEDYFKDAVLTSYLGNTIYLPTTINPTDRSPLAPVRQLCSSKKNLTTNKWDRPANGNDHLFMASMFAEASLFHWLEKTLEYSANSCEWMRDLKPRT